MIVVLPRLGIGDGYVRMRRLPETNFQQSGSSLPSIVLYLWMLPHEIQPLQQSPKSDLQGEQEAAPPVCIGVDVDWGFSFKI